MSIAAQQSVLTTGAASRRAGVLATGVFALCVAALAHARPDGAATSDLPLAVEPAPGTPPVLPGDGEAGLWAGVPLIDIGPLRLPVIPATFGPTPLGLTVTGGAVALADVAVDGVWDVSDIGQPVSRLRVRSERAAGIRLRVSASAIPEGGVLRVLDERGVVVTEITAAQGPSWWTPTIEGEVAHIEYVGPPESTELPGVEVLDVAVIDADAVAPDVAGLRSGSACSGGSPSLACHIEVPAQNLQRAVARLSYISDQGGVFACTGTLVRDAQGDTPRPYLLTAAHCIDTSSEAATVEVVWNYFATGGQSPCLASLPANEGATLGATVPEADMSVLVLRSPAPAGAFAAPIRLDVVSTSERGFTSIHQPGGGSQRYFVRPAYNDNACVFSGGSWRNPGNYGFAWVEGQSSGIAESGSSGAPLIDAQGNVRGTLRGLCYPVGAANNLCGQRANVVIFFGSLSHAWTNGLASAFAPPPTDDTFEPNDTISEARPIAAAGAALDLQLIDLDDWFSFTAGSAGSLLITLTGAPATPGIPYDPDVLLYSSNAALIASSLSATTTERIALDIPAGTYYIRVNRASTGTFQVGSYRLTPRFTAAPSQGEGTSGPTPTVTPITSPVVDRQLESLQTRLDAQVAAASLRASRTVGAIQTSVSRLRSRGADSARIDAVVDRTLLTINKLRSSASLTIDRLVSGTTRTLDRLGRRDAQVAAAAAYAGTNDIPARAQAATAALDQVYDDAVVMLEALRDPDVITQTTP